MAIPTQLSAIVQVTGFNNFGFGQWIGYGDLESTDSICVYRNNSDRYRIRIRGSGPGNALEVTDGPQTLPYSVEVRGSTTAWRTMRANQRRTFRQSERSSTNCNGGTNAEIRISFSEADLSFVRANSFSGTLVVILSN